MTIAPASSHFLIHHDVSSLSVRKSSLLPSVLEYPLSWTSSFTATGTPSNGPSGFPFLYRSVDAAAAARMRSSRDSRNATACGPSLSPPRRISGSRASTTAVGVSSPDR